MRSVGLGLALVASIQFAVAPAFAQDPPKPAAATSGTAAAAPAAPGMVTVHINSTEKKVTLEKRETGTSAWEHVCNSPCDVATSVSAQYQVIGDDLNPSRPFLLDSSGGDKITLDITPGVNKKASLGTWIVVGGAALIIGGVITLAAGSKSTTAPGDDGTVTNNTNTDFISVGSVVVLAGVIVAMTGGAFMYDNAHTKVEGSIGDVPDKGGSDLNVKAHVQVTAERGPTWHHDSGPQLAPSQFVSILHGSF